MTGAALPSSAPSVAPVRLRVATPVGVPPRLTAVVITGALVVGCLLIFLTGNPLVALAPMVMIVGAMVLWRTSVRALLLGYVALTLGVSVLPRLKPIYIDYKPWTYPIMLFFQENLNKVTGVEALRFSGAELFYLIVLAVLFGRRLLGVPIDDRERVPVASLLPPVLLTAVGIVLVLEVWGVLRGGDVRQSLWQFRAVLWMPIMTALFAFSLRGTRDFLPIAFVLTGASAFKTCIGTWYLYRQAWPEGLEVESMSGHDDSMLYTAVAMLWIAAWVHHPTRQAAYRAAILGGVGLFAIAVNGRRLAFVELGGCLALLFFLMRGPLKRFLTRMATFLFPLFLVYVVIGGNRNGAIFKPAKSVMSVFEQKDRSSLTRDIENFNLIQTLKPNIIIGTGWGHEYNEVNKADDISAAFAQYRYIAHNSVLWLLSIGGFVGFFFLWLPVCVAAFLAARSYRLAQNAEARTAAMFILSVCFAFSQQAWGDMGTQGMFHTLIVAMAVALSGQLAVETGAWPWPSQWLGARRGSAYSLTPAMHTGGWLQ